MEYSTTKTKAKTMSINPEKELFDSSAPPPASAPPPTPSSTKSAASANSEDREYDREEAREREIEGSAGVPGTGEGTLHLSVTDPKQIGEGRNAHTYYRIDVRQGQYTADPIASVRRRYSDFQWLFQRLHAERPGAIVPIIPHTQAVQMAKRLGEELIGERRVHLEGFLRRVQVHPELEGAPSLAAFFSPDAEVFEAAKKANPGTGVDETTADDCSPAEKAKEKVKHFFVKAGIKAKVARGGELEETADGARMEAVESYLTTLENHIKNLARATLFLVNASKETSTTMHELGQSLFGLHQTYDPESASENDEEPSEAPKGRPDLPSVKAISNAFASLSAINKVKHDENHDKVGIHVHDLEWSIKAARLAVKRRKAAQLTYATFLQQIKNRESAVEKAHGAASVSPRPGSHDVQVAAAQKLLVAAKLNADKALRELEAVTQRVYREMDRFKGDVDTQLRNLYASHARVQVDYSRQLDGEWGKLLPKGKGGEGGGVGNGGPGGAMSGLASTQGSKSAETLMI